MVLSIPLWVSKTCAPWTPTLPVTGAKSCPAFVSGLHAAEHHCSTFHTRIIGMSASTIAGIFPQEASELCPGTTALHSKLSSTRGRRKGSTSQELPAVLSVGSDSSFHPPYPALPCCGESQSHSFWKRPPRSCPAFSLNCAHTLPSHHQDIPTSQPRHHEKRKFFLFLSNPSTNMLTSQV